MVWGLFGGLRSKTAAKLPSRAFTAARRPSRTGITSDSHKRSPQAVVTGAHQGRQPPTFAADSRRAMDPAWSSHGRPVHRWQLSHWGLQLCVELMVYVTSLLLVLICMVAWLRTIYWALFGSGSRRPARCPELARTVGDGGGEESVQWTAVSPSPRSPSPLPPPPKRNIDAITALSDRLVLCFVQYALVHLIIIKVKSIT